MSQVVGLTGVTHELLIRLLTHLLTHSLVGLFVYLSFDRYDSIKSTDTLSTLTRVKKGTMSRPTDSLV